MGAAARRLADHVVVTSDNPRSEDPDAIIAAIVAGRRARRRRRWAESLARWRSSPTAARRSSARWSSRGRATSCMIAGKGHEQGQEFEGGRKIPFDDREVAREALRARSARSPGLRRPVIELTPEEIALPARALLVAGPAGRAGTDAAGARGRRLARWRRRATCSSGIAGERATAARSPSAIEAGAGAWSSRPSTPAARRRSRSGARAGDRGRRPARRAGRARAPLGARARGARSAHGRASPARPARPRRRTSSRRCCARVHGGALHANPANYNTEIGLPLTVLEAAGDTRVLVLEMAMRGMGQIRELREIARPRSA